MFFLNAIIMTMETFITLGLVFVALSPVINKFVVYKIKKLERKADQELQLMREQNDSYGVTRTTSKYLDEKEFLSMFKAHDLGSAVANTFLGVVMTTVLLVAAYILKTGLEKSDQPPTNCVKPVNSTPASTVTSTISKDKK